jgi:hypothetical protein
MNVLNNLSPQARMKLGVALLTAFLFSWAGISFGIQAMQVVNQGYGSGIINRRHLPDQVRERFHVGKDVTPEELMNMTSR